MVGGGWSGPEVWCAVCGEMVVGWGGPAVVGRGWDGGGPVVGGAGMVGKGGGGGRDGGGSLVGAGE